MRKKVYQMVHIYKGSRISVIYKYVMTFFILLSLLPLTVKEKPSYFVWLESTCLAVFVIDYLLRWFTADYKLGQSGWKAFVRYPFRIISIIDMLSIFALICSIFRLLDSFKLTQTMSVFRIVRVFRYAESVRTIMQILKKSRKPLTAVGSLAVGYIMISAIVMFNAEPDSFNTFFDVIYWATVSLTTVGYGDIYPVTMLGRTIAMISSFFGIAIVALPAGIVTAEYLNALKETTK